MNRLLIITFVFSIVGIGACHLGKGRDTPKEFLNQTKIDLSISNTDKASVTKQIENLISTHAQSFYSAEYFDSTLLVIDTILYSEDKNRIAAFVFTKNPTSRQLDPKKHKWYYNAYCYLGKRQSDTFDLRWLNRFNLSNYYDQQLAVNRLRELYFKKFATWKNTDDSYRYGVNLDDKRFWNCYVWQEYFSY